MTQIQPKEYAAWLVQLSIECGLVSQGGMGLASITWQEIKAWQSVTSNHNIWIAKAIKRLSEYYISEHRKAADPTRPSPLQSYVDVIEQRKKVSRQIKQIFR